MKKTLIVPVVAAMLAVSCGSAPAGDWSKADKDFMSAELGEVLPYLSLDKKSAEVTYASDEFGGYFAASDAGSKDLTVTYGEKLVKAGFEYSELVEAYGKVTEKSQVIAYLSYDEGNSLYVEYLYKDAPTGGAWSEELQEKMTSSFGEVLPYVYLDEEEVGFDNITEVSFAIYSFESEVKFASFGARLEQAGFEFSSYFGGYVKDIESMNFSILVDFGVSDMGSYLYHEIDISIISKEYESFPASAVEAMYGFMDKDSSYYVPEMSVASDEAKFVYEEDLSLFSLGMAFANTYVYGSNPLEVQTYVANLIAYGWLLPYEPAPAEPVASEVLRDTEEPSEEPAEPVVYWLYYPGTFADVEIYDYSGIEDEEDPYSAVVSFGYIEDEVEPEIDNGDVIASIAYIMGVSQEAIVAPTEEGDTKYSFKTTMELPALEYVEGSIYQGKVVPGSFTFSQDLFEQVKDGEGTVIKYINYFLVDGYEEGAQFIKIVVEWESEGVVAISVEVEGKPVKIEWSAQKACQTVVDYFNSLTGRSDEANDESEDYGFPAFTYSLMVGLPSIDYMEYYLDNAFAKLKGFKVDVDWTAGTFQDGTAYEKKEMSYDNVSLSVYVYEDEGYMVFELYCFEIPENPEAAE